MPKAKPPATSKSRTASYIKLELEIMAAKISVNKYLRRDLEKKLRKVIERGDLLQAQLRETRAKNAKKGKR